MFVLLSEMVRFNECSKIRNYFFNNLNVKIFILNNDGYGLIKDIRIVLK